MPAPVADTQLPAIPLIETGPDFPMATLIAQEALAGKLIAHATRRLPRSALKGLDAVSRRWLVKHANAHLPEIDAIARRLGRPGAYFLSVNYEWGCTVGVGPSPDGKSARMVRTLDWMTEGLGRYVMAANVACPQGSFLTLTWPGYTGILQALAPGRFVAALNQAPMRPLGGGIYAVDWAANRARVWRSPYEMPAHLLRRVVEEAPDFATARRRLIETRISTPAIYTLAGIAPHETSVIERTETEAHVIDGRAFAGNHWQAPGWRGRSRGVDSSGRAARMAEARGADLDPAFPWLVPPIRNELTRLAMVADAGTGQLVVQGFEPDGPATRPLVWSA